MKSDLEIAAEFKAKALLAAEPVLKIMEEIKQAGYECTIQFGINPTTNKMLVFNFMIFKILS